MHQAATGGRPSGMTRLFQGIQDEACMRRPADPPANDPTGEGVDDEG